MTDNPPRYGSISLKMTAEATPAQPTRGAAIRPITPPLRTDSNIPEIQRQTIGAYANIDMQMTKRLRQCLDRNDRSNATRQSLAQPLVLAGMLQHLGWLDHAILPAASLLYLKLIEQAQLANPRKR